MQSKTPILQDKRLFLTIATVIAFFAFRFLGIELDTEMVAGIAATVIGYITNSALKEAMVSKAMVEANTDAAPAAPVAPTTAASTIAKLP